MLAYHAIKSQRVRTILILDDDVGFVFWCGHILIAAGYLAVSALSVPNAKALIDSFNLHLDVLVFNPLLPGVADFISELRAFQRQVQVIAAVEYPTEAAAWPTDACTTKLKPSVADETQAAGWLNAVDSLLLGTTARC